MKLFKNNFKLTAILSAVMLLTSACGATAPLSQSVTLQVWGTFETTANMLSFINGYEKLHPNVKIVYTEKNIDTYEDDLLNALAVGQGPDIFSIHNDWLPKYADKLVPAPSNIYSLKDLNDNYVDVIKNDFMTSDGKLYAMPIAVDSLALYYNKDILGSFSIAQPPRTWDELKQDVRRISKADSTGYFTRSGVAMGTSTNINRPQDILYLLMLQNGAVPYTSDNSSSTLDLTQRDSNGNVLFPAADAIKFYTSFADPNSDVYTWNNRSNYSIDAFSNGQLAFMYGYSYTRAQILQKSPNLNFDVAPVPQPNLNNNVVNFANYFGFGVSKQSKNPNNAWTFINYMTSKEALTAYNKLNNLPSPRKDIISQQINDPNIGVFAAANLTAKSFYKKDAAKVDKIIQNLIDAVILQGTSINGALSIAIQQINLLNQH